MMISVEAQYDKSTNTLTYIVWDSDSKDALVIDPVMDYDQYSGKYSFHSIQKTIQFIKDHNLKLHLILETHVHADHLSGAQPLLREFPTAQSGIGKNIIKVQKAFKNIFNLSNDFRTDGSQFNHLLDEENEITAGSISVKTIFTPGHTPACSSYLIGENLFTGDALFMPDFGTGRCDFPAGSAEDLYHSIHEKLYQLPDDTITFTGHDYQPGGRDLEFMSTIGEQKKKNIQLKAETAKEEYISFRTERDKLLNAPKLLFPSLYINIRAGHLPPAEENGVSYIKLPITPKDN